MKFSLGQTVVALQDIELSDTERGISFMFREGAKFRYDGPDPEKEGNVLLHDGNTLFSMGISETSLSPVTPSKQTA